MRRVGSAAPWRGRHAGPPRARPLAVAREDWLNLGVVFFLVALAQSWNVIGGLAGQVNLGHAAFFGLGALVTAPCGRLASFPWRWRRGAVAAPAGLGLGLVAFRLRGAYFAIGTLALAEVLRLTVGNVLPEVSTLPAATIAGYRLPPASTWPSAGAGLGPAGGLAPRSRLGLAMQAVREDEAAASASGVSALASSSGRWPCPPAWPGWPAGSSPLPHQLLSPARVQPDWTFDAVLDHLHRRSGYGHGPVLGAALFVFLRDIWRSAGWTSIS